MESCSSDSEIDMRLHAHGHFVSADMQKLSKSSGVNVEEATTK